MKELQSALLFWRVLISFQLGAQRFFFPWPVAFTWSKTTPGEAAWPSRTYGRVALGLYTLSTPTRTIVSIIRHCYIAIAWVVLDFYRHISYRWTYTDVVLLYITMVVPFYTSIISWCRISIMVSQFIGLRRRVLESRKYDTTILSAIYRCSCRPSTLFYYSGNMLFSSPLIMHSTKYKIIRFSCFVHDGTMLLFDYCRGRWCHGSVVAGGRTVRHRWRHITGIQTMK